MSCQTPIAFLIFRRPDLTARVFEAIRQAQPHKLFIVADGAGNEHYFRHWLWFLCRVKTVCSPIKAVGS